jgi:hypothetical protein
MVGMAATRPVRIHLPWTAVILPLMLFVCITPLATAGGAWIVLYVFPAALLIGLLLAGTTATAGTLTARWTRGWTRLAWDQVQQLEFPGQRWAVAVTSDGRRVVLPGVRPADLPRIVQAAGGRLFLRRRVSEGEPAADQQPERAPDDPDAPGARGPDGRDGVGTSNRTGAATDTSPATGTGMDTDIDIDTATDSSSDSDQSASRVGG